MGVPTYADGDNVRYVIDGAELVPRSIATGRRQVATRRASAITPHRRLIRPRPALRRCARRATTGKSTIATARCSSTASRRAARLANYEVAQTHQDLPLGPRARGRRCTALRRTSITRWTTTPAAPEPSRELYPASIDYTAGPGLAAAYSIRFRARRPVRGRSAVISGRQPGSVTRPAARRSRRVPGQIVDYVLTYGHSQLKRPCWRECGSTTAPVAARRGGNAFATPACQVRRSSMSIPSTTLTRTRGSRRQAWQVQDDPDAAAARSARARPRRCRAVQA